VGTHFETLQRPFNLPVSTKKAAAANGLGRWSVRAAFQRWSVGTSTPSGFQPDFYMEQQLSESPIYSGSCIELLGSTPSGFQPDFYMEQQLSESPIYSGSCIELLGSEETIRRAKKVACPAKTGLEMSGAARWLVPTLRRGNAFRDAPASFQSTRFHEEGGDSLWLGKPGSSGTGRWSVRACVPTLERWNEHPIGLSAGFLHGTATFRKPHL
jgi:hypothetical protein